MTIEVYQYLVLVWLTFSAFALTGSSYTVIQNYNNITIRFIWFLSIASTIASALYVKNVL